MSDSVHEVQSVLLGSAWASIAANTEVDIRDYYASPLKRECSATLVAQLAGSSDSGTLAVKIQVSADTVDGDFADLTNAAFTTLTDLTAPGAGQTIYFTIPTGKYFVRTYATVVGTVGNGGWYGSCLLNMVSRQAG